MGVRGPCARPRRLLASELAFALALAFATLLALLVPGAQALDECALYSKDGVLVDDLYWDSAMISLAHDEFATEPLQDTAGPNFVYYRFKTENIHSVQINQMFEDAIYFKAYLDGDNLVIATSDEFVNIEKDTNRDTTTAAFVLLEIGCGSTTNIRKLQLDMMMFDNNNWKPEAKQSSYSLSLPVPVPAGTILLEVPGFDYDMTGLGVEVSVEEDNAQYQGLFGASASYRKVDRAFTVTLSSAMEIRVKEPVAFTLRIKDLGTSDEPTVIQEWPVRVTFTPDLENSVFSPRFQRALYTANVLEAEEVSAGTAVLAAPIAFEEGFTENLNLALEDGDMHSGVPATEFVEVVRVGEALELRWKAALDADRLAAFLAQPYALLLLTATAANAPQTGRTVVHLALPGAYTGTPEPTVRLRFEPATYSKHLNRDDPKGELVAQPRLANPDAVSGVRFSLEKEWEASPLGLLEVNSISGAVTLLVSPPPAGTFLYRIVASAPGAHPAYAQLLVMGPAGVECNEDSDEKCFTHAVSVQWINEHIAQDVLGAMPVQDCTFSVLSGQEYFDVDARTGAARMRAVDREDAAFDGAEAPVLRLWVHMSCAGAGDGDAARTPPVARAGNDYGNWANMLGNVEHNPRSTVVLVEIVDINDNTPVFNPPSIVVGFPDSSLAERLRLPALFTAQATDRDVGLNAQLHYSLDEAGADVLQVDAVSGAVYPRSDVPPPASGQRVVVRATDRNGPFGADGSRTGNLDVTLVALAEEHLVEVRVEGALPEEAEQLLQDGAGSGRELRLLSATVLPGEGSRAAAAAAPTPLPHLLRVRRAPQQDNSQDEDDGGDADENEGEETFAAHLRVVLYSLRNGNPESADQFKEEVEEQLKTNGWQAKAETPQLGGGGGGGGGGDAGLLAAVITLAVLLGLLLVAAGIVGYWFGVRPRMAQGKRLSENGSPSQLSVVDIEPLRDEMLKKPPSPTMAYGDDSSVAGQGRGLGLAPPPGADALRPSVMLGLPGEADARDTESDDYMPAPSEGYERPRPASENSYEELLPELAPAPAPAAAPEADGASVTSDPPARKSVFFNEEVDCIEIRM